MTININDLVINKLLPGKAGRGRPGGLKPVLMVMHIEEGGCDLSEYFKHVAADSTFWNPAGATDKLVRLMHDSDTVWTNGLWTEPINHANPVIAELYRRRVSTNDVSLTIEHAGWHTAPISPAQLERSAQICAYWCTTWNLPADRYHIVGHYEVGEHKQCPGPLFPFDLLVARTQQILRQGGQTAMELPFNSVLNPDGAIFCRDTGCTLNFGMKDFALTLGRTQPLPTGEIALAQAYYEFVKLFGLVIGPEMKLADGKTYQACQRSVLCYDPTITDLSWQIQPIHLGRDWLDKQATTTTGQAKILEAGGAGEGQ